MKKGVKWIALVILAALVALIVYRFVHKPQIEEEETRPTVRIGRIEKRDIVNTTSCIGTIEPQEEVAVMPRMAGEIMEVFFNVGDTVEEGQVLIRIHSDSLDSLRIQADSARVNMEDAARALQRTEALFPSGAVSQQQLESAQSAAKNTRLAYENAATQLNLYTGYTEVKAPISGVVETKNVEPHDQASPAASICTISGSDGMRITFGVNEDVMKRLNLGDEVRAEIGQNELVCTVTEISGKTSARSGLFDCKAQFDGADSEGLTSGTKAEVLVISNEAKGVDAIPMSSVTYSNGEPFVYLFEDHKSVKRDIVTGLYDGDWIEVKEGLSASDPLIVTWSNEIYNGAAVRTVEEAEAGSAGTDAAAQPE